MLKTDHVIAAAALCLFFTWGTAAARELGQTASPERQPHHIPRVNAHITADGILDEPLWSDALTLPLEYEVRPGENIPPPVKTDVMLAYNETDLLVAFRAYDPDPSLIWARLADRDELYDDDWVAINLDTFNDQRRSYLFVCNPLGVQADYIETEGGSGCEFDAIWDSGGRVTDEGYVVEMCIPFRALRFQRSESDQVWGIDAIRSYPRVVRHHIGLFPRDRNNNCYLCQAEKIVGFAGVAPGRSVEVIPTLSGIRSQIRSGEESIPQGDFIDEMNDIEAGVTGKWGLTPNLTFCGTLNPDFSQIEADRPQVDVNTQFSLWFPERRPFFLEGMHMFESRLGLIYTRTIADPDWGFKLTGKEGSNVIGVFMAQDAVTNFLLPDAYGSYTAFLAQRSRGTVIRYRRDVNSSASAGLMFTDRRGEDYFNTVASFDGDFRITQKDRIQVAALSTSTTYPRALVDEEDVPAVNLTGSALDVFYFHNTRTLDWYGVVRRIEPGVRLDLGFRPQVDYNYGEAGFGYTVNRESGSWYTVLNAGAGYEYETTTGDELIQKGATAWFNYDGPKQAFFNFNGYFGKNRYEGSEFGINRGFFEGGLFVSGSLFAMAWAVVGDQVDYENVQPGRVLTLSPVLEYKMGLHLKLRYEHQYERLSVEGGRLYTANTDYLGVIYQFNRRAFARVVLHYVDYDYNAGLYDDPPDPEYRDVFTQLLFAYKINPQTVLYVGYSDNYEANHIYKLTQTGRTLFAKLGYALNI